MISVVIPTNQNKSLNKCLLALKAVDPDEVIVVENPDQVEETKNLVESMGFTYLVSKAGSNRARNMGIRTARNDFVAIIDDDICVHENWYRVLVNHFLHLEDRALVGGRVELDFAEEKPPWLVGVFTAWLSAINWDETGEVDFTDGQYLVSANMAFPKVLWQRVGGFKEDIGYQTRESFMSNDELEFVEAVAKKAHIFYNHDLIAYHCIPTVRTTLEYFMHRSYGQGYSDGQMWLRKHKPNTPLEDIYHLYVQTHFLHIANIDHIFDVREHLSNEEYTREYIRRYILCQHAHMTGVLHALERNDAKNDHVLPW